MESFRPAPDLWATFKHSVFDELAAKFAPEILKWRKKAKGTVTMVPYVEAKVGGSDIKWNDFFGTLKIECHLDKQRVYTPFWVNINAFTGNCGFKSIDHLCISLPPTVFYTQQKEWKEIYQWCLGFLESFLYHRTNCGYVLGSDSHYGDTYSILKHYGVNYQYSPEVWNPNYTWNKSHRVLFFYKNLNSQEYPNYWTDIFDMQGNKMDMSHEKVKTEQK